MALTVRKFKNEYYLNNTNLTSSTYSVGLASNCCSCEVNAPETTEYSISPGQEKQLLFPIDGEYIVRIPATGTPTDTFYINYYPSLQERLIKDIKAFLCGDGCYHCNGMGVKAELENLVKYQNIFNEFLTYQLFTSYNVQDSTCDNCKNTLFIQRAVRLYRCDIQKELCIQLNTSDFYGKAEGSLELFKKFMAIYYLAMYFQDYDNATNDDEREFIDDLYQICDIKRCISKLGLDIDELRLLFEETQEDMCANDPCPECPECPDPEVNLPPTSAANINLLIDQSDGTAPITIDKFINGYIDPENDFIHSIRIMDTVFDDSVSETKIVLEYKGNALVIGDVISVSDLITGEFTYQLVDELATVGVTVKYEVADAGSKTFGAQGEIYLHYTK